jgi:chemotaxis protein methyltransferase CheR
MAFTYFFRDMQTLETIRDHVVPYLRSRRYIHIWDAGCAMGQEPYSVAMMLRENMGHMIFRNVKIHATDIDTSNLFGEVIQAGVYPEEQVKRIPPEIFAKYFVSADKPNHFCVSEEIRKRVSYQKHDLLSFQPIRKDFLLIVCKNVLLHFKPTERIQVMQMFYDSLEDGGFLVTEQTQKIPEELEGLFEPVVSNAQLFRKMKTKGG